MASSEIDFMLERLKETRDPRFLLFLSNLCVCNDRPIPSTQGIGLSLWAHGLALHDMDAFLPPDTILEKLVIPHGKSVFFRLEVGGSDFCPNEERGVVFYQRPDGPSQWIRLLDIASRVSPYINVCVQTHNI